MHAKPTRCRRGHLGPAWPEVQQHPRDDKGGIHGAVEFSCAACLLADPQTLYDPIAGCSVDVRYDGGLLQFLWTLVARLSSPRQCGDGGPEKSGMEQSSYTIRSKPLTKSLENHLEVTSRQLL